MSYEAGSKECRHLIEAKESLLSTLDALSNIHSTDLIQIQIKEIYNKLCINLALDHAKKRINLLENSDKKCVLEEYKEWINDGLNKHTVLLLRDDPII